MNCLGRILVVEDSPPNRLILSHLLKKLNFEVVEAEDGEQALKALAEGPIDAVLTDLMMPNLDGLQLLQRIRSDEKWKQLPVILVTALNEEASLAKAEALGCTASIFKPISMKDIHKHLQPLFPALAQLEKAG